MDLDPLRLAASYLIHRARQRARAALAGNPESGSLTVELIFIAAFLVALALIAAVFFRNKLRAEMSQIP